MEIDFEYRALDLLADYEPGFSYFPSTWKKTIKTAPKGSDVPMAFASLVYEMVSDALAKFGEGLSDDQFGDRLGHMTERDDVACKLMRDLGLDSPIAVTTVTYFAGRRNLIEDERAWTRFCNLLEEQISLSAC